MLFNTTRCISFKFIFQNSKTLSRFTPSLTRSRCLCKSNYTIIYTDGSCKNNGRSGSSAGIGVYFGENDVRNLSEKLPGQIQTNQRAELYSVIRALESVDSNENVEIRSDSIYLVKGMNEWSKEWIKNGWTKDIKNKDLFMKLCEITEKRKGETKFVHVKAHGDDIGNINADKLAVQASHQENNEKK